MDEFDETNDLYERIYNKRDNINFIHFASIEECDNYIKNNNIIFLQRCCSGKGYGYLKNDLLLEEEDYKENADCVICYEFIKTKNTECCKQTLCKECNKKCGKINNNCPHCRNQTVYNKNSKKLNLI